MKPMTKSEARASIERHKGYLANLRAGTEHGAENDHNAIVHHEAVIECLQLLVDTGRDPFGRLVPE